MSLNAQGYFNALRSYLNRAHYEATETDGGRIVMKEKIYLPGSQTAIEQKVRMLVTGEAIVINLDKKISRNNNQSHPLFHFLDDNAKPWSKRCDFVIFHRVRERINVHCFEFKSATFPETLVDQLEASEAWCRSLHSTIKHYTGVAKRLHLTNSFCLATKTRRHISTEPGNTSNVIIPSATICIKISTVYPWTPWTTPTSNP